ncbi:MAG: FAD-dependent oxidoreductase [Roseiarcus sp.]
MSPSKTDVIVLGAGIVGVCAALHLQARGRAVTIVDRLGAVAGETSSGNSGIVQSEAVFPYVFPRAPGEIALGALNLDPRVQIRYSSLPAIAPWLWRYFLASSPRSRMATGMAMRGLVLRCLAEHRAIAEPAGAGALLREGGWIKVFRTSRGEDLALADIEETRPYGVGSAALNREQLVALEPHLSGVAKGGVHFTESLSTSDPEALAKAYADLLLARGGRLSKGDARSLEASGAGWAVAAEDGPLQAADVVVALGAWASDVTRALGYRLPLGVKRGYHMHYGAKGEARLNRPVLDLEKGYIIAPMARGVRLTTGAEFARRDDPPSSAHLDRLEPSGRELFPLAERRDARPWLGRRPCLPDMAPIIGPAPRHKGLWFDFGHQHLGLTLGPVSGLLLAQIMAGDTPFVDPKPFRAERFG